MNSSVSGRSHSPIAVLFVALLLIMIVVAFYSFAVGAFIVFNRPLSNVVAQTTDSNGQTILTVNASSLYPNKERTIWIDPQLTSISNGTGTGIIASSGYQVANVTTDDSGSVLGSFVLSPNKLAQLESNGNAIHTVWIVGNSGALYNSSGTFWNLTADTEINYTVATQADGLILFASLFEFSLPIHYDLGQLFIFLWISYVVLFAVALNGPGKNLLAATKAGWNGGLRKIFDNSMLGTMAVFPVVLWASALAALIQQAGGISTGSLPPTDGLVLYISLAIAPLREEIGFRVIPIGVVALLILLFKGRIRDGMMALWHPSRYLKRNDSPSEYKHHLLLIYIFIGLSAVIFGLAHVLSGSGWGPGKILDAAIGGLALAFLYYRYGFAAAVLLHWAIDVFLSTFPLTSGIYNGIVLYSILLALASTAVLFYLLVKRMTSKPSPGLLPTVS